MNEAVKDRVSDIKDYVDELSVSDPFPVSLERWMDALLVQTISFLVDKSEGTRNQL